MDAAESGFPESGLKSRAAWFVRARPLDYIIAAASASAAIPLVGRHLEPVGGMIAMAAWGQRHAPTSMSTAVRSALAPDAAKQRQRQRAQTSSVAQAALRGVVPPERLNIPWPAPQRWAPVLGFASQRRRYLYRSDVRYGAAPGQVLDVWRRKDLPLDAAPVLVFVPGGAWVQGSRMLQGGALMSHLVEQGWVCLSINYRVAPRHPWPRHLQDVKAAVAWTRAHVGDFGGDPEFVAIAGCSAGGHLAALAGLTGDDPAFRAGLPTDADTSVDAVVGIYGRYDWEDRSTPERYQFMDFLERVVVKKRYERHPHLFRAASPMAQVRADAPPFLVVHGSADNVIPVPQARAFVEKLRTTSRSTVAYLELPGATHAFDLTDGTRTGPAATVIGLFLAEVHRTSGPGGTKRGTRHAG